MAEQTGVSPDVLPLPSGGGSVSSMGETFNADLFTGTGSYSVPLWFPRGPGGFTPELSLSYSTTTGNGPFGMGWSLSILKLWRQTDRGVPDYSESHQLIFAGEEVLAMPDGSYRGAKESRFNRIESSGLGFIVKDRSGKRFEMGLTAQGREQYVTPEKTLHSAWVLEKAVDTHGNEIKYEWLEDQGRLYLKRIQYGPYELSFHYSAREDSQRSYRTGYAITTALRCDHIEYRLLNEGNALFKRYVFHYQQDTHSRLSLLSKIECIGERIVAGVPESAALPELTFDYQAFALKAEYLPYRSDANVAEPTTQQNVNTNLVDMNARGLPGVIQADGPLRRFWPSRTKGRFGKPRTLRTLPNGLNLADRALLFADMDGSGSADVLMLEESPLGYLKNDPGQGWRSQRSPFRSAPSFDVNDTNLRLVDLNGDGRVDVIRSSQNYFYVYFNQQNSWGKPLSIPRVRDLSKFPDVTFSDPRVQFADMTGDGLMDLVWIHGSRIDYWPNLGNGHFDSRQQLQVSPSLAKKFDIRRFFLLDINGDGITDIVYVERNHVKVWVNQSGNALTYVGDINNTPLTDGSNIRIADMEGSGMPGLLWSYPSGQVAGGNYKYLALAGTDKPYLMQQIDNGLGLRTKISYDSSARLAQEAQEKSQTWDSSPPFPLQVVTDIEEIDTLSGAHIKRKMRYRNGLFNGDKREFLGFEQVSVLEDGGSDSPSSETTSWFHQGRTGLLPGASSEQRQMLAGRLERIEVRDLGVGGAGSRLLRRERNFYEVKALGIAANGQTIFFPHLASARVENLEGENVGSTVLTQIRYDNFGNIIARDEQWDALSPVSVSQTQIRLGQFRYSAEFAGNTISNLPVEYIERDDTGNIMRLRRYYYDGADFTGLPFGQVTQGKLSRVENLVFTESLFNTNYVGLGLNALDFGYHAITLPDGTHGWAANTLRQKQDAHGNTLARRDAFGNTGTIAYDAFNIAPVSVTDPVGLPYKGSYDYRAAQLSEVEDPNGQKTQYRFDPIGRLSAVIKPEDSEIQPTQIFRHDTTALPASILIQMREESDTAKTVDTIEYVDGRGQVLQRRSQAEGGQVIVDAWRSYNNRGWESERSIPFFSAGMDYIAGEGAAVVQRFAFQYDALGRIIATQTPDGHHSKTEFLPAKVTRFDVTDMDNSTTNIARGHFDTPRTEHTDAKGGLLSVAEMKADRSLVRTHYRRDAMAQLSAIVDARGIQTVAYRYDLLGRKIHVDHVDAGVRRRLFDARGDLAHHYDALNRPVVITYDSARRKTEVKVDDVVEETYQYDVGTGNHVKGRVARVNDSVGQVDFSYTQRGLYASKIRKMTTAVGNETFSLQFQYDAMERVTKVTRPDASEIEYQYNERGLSQVPGIIASTQRNALNQLTQLELANGIMENYHFDASSFYLTKLEIARHAGTGYFDVDYQYDAAGNPLSIQDNIVAIDHIQYDRQFTYDALSRLTGMTGNHGGNAVQLNYHYDAAGNFTHNDTLSSDDLFLEANGSNRLSGVKSATGNTVLFNYDANGALTSSPGRNCQFDARGRLRRVTLSTGSVIDYHYSYSGQRIKKQITKPGVADRESLYIEEYFERLDGVNTRFILADGRRIAAQTVADGTHYLHADHLGNIILVTDDAGNKIGEIGYRPFGGALFNSLPNNMSRRGFIGCEQDDESGLVYCAARFYDPVLGRFISVDPYLLYSPEDALLLPGNLNLYVYAANNPMRQIDNQGTFWKWIVGALIIIALVVATIVVGVFTGGAGFAFGILLAASIGSALGAGMGVASAAMAGGSADDMANGFLFGAIVGGAAGAAGYAAGAAVGAIGISGVWGSILAGAAQGALIGAGNGAIIGYAGGLGSVEDVFIHMGIGFLLGAVMGGLSGYLAYDPSVAGNAVNSAISTGTATATDPITGATISQSYNTGLGVVGQAAGNATTQLVGAIANPIVFASVGSAHHLVITYYWDDIKTALLEAFGGEEEEIIITI